jgi:chromate transporter
MLELVLRFLLIGAVAFGGGQAALPLVERITVAETGWLTSSEFAVGIGLAYATPGPVLILAAYVGYHVGGVLGALAATAAVFAVPVTLAATAAHVVARLSTSERFRAFGRFAGVAAVGLLGSTLIFIAQPLLAAHPALILGAAVVVVADRRGASPILILAVAAVIGGAVGAQLP